MPLIVEIAHADYSNNNVAKDARAVQYFLEKEKRFSLDEFKRRISYDYLIDLINEYGHAKLYDKKGNCIGGVFYADDLMTVEERNKHERNKHERNKAFGIA